MNNVLIELNVKRFLICSTGEETVIAHDPQSLELAKKVRDEKQENDIDETWSIVAEIDA